MIRSTLLALALMASPAWAQDEEELTAAPGSIAIGMIEEADAEGIFDIVHNGEVSVRHLGSGLQCDFARDGSGGDLTVFPLQPRGDDVACDYDYDEYRMTVYASRYPGPPPLDSLLAGASDAIRQTYRDAREIEPDYEIEMEGAPPYRVARFLLTRDGVRQYSSVHIAQIGAWTIKQRYTAPAPTAEAAREADLAATMMFLGTINDIAATPNL